VEWVTRCDNKVVTIKLCDNKVKGVTIKLKWSGSPGCDNKVAIKLAKNIHTYGIRSYTLNVDGSGQPYKPATDSYLWVRGLQHSPLMFL